MCLGKKILRIRSSPVAMITIVAIVFLLPSEKVQGQLPKAMSSSQAGTHYFTVKDSIEMLRFSRDLGSGKSTVIFSPNKRYFATVTSRGVMQSDEIESTIWIFRSEAVKKYLTTHGDAEAPAPWSIAKFAAVPTVDYLASYESIVSDVQWLPNSSSILFLVRSSHKKRELYQVDLSSGSARALTAAGRDVFQFKFKDGVIVYRAAQSGESRPQTIDSTDIAARDVTGVPLQTILFPERQRFDQYSELRVIRNGRDVTLRDPTNSQPIRLLNSIQVPEFNPLSISPGGTAVAVLLPSKEIKKSWESYEPEPTLPGLKLRSGDPGAVADSNWDRPVQYALVNLKTGESKSLVNAPSGDSLGYDDQSHAVWSEHGGDLLLTNTYLSLDEVGDSERSKRLRPCAAAVINLNSSGSSCLAFSRGNGSPLLNASFGEDDNEVVLRFGNTSVTLLGPREERYRRVNEGWQLSKSSSNVDNYESSPDKDANCPTSVSRRLSIEVRQDLNTPPTLWARDCASGISKRIWDPNPNLATLALGEASVFHWRDKTGYEWTGGLIKPPGHVPGLRYPLVIQTHGFYENEFMTDGSFTTAFAARPLASTGLVVLQIPTNHNHLNTSDEVPDQIRGIDSAIDKLDSGGLIDRSRVGIIGFSRTSYHVESLLIKEPSRFAAATIADGFDASYMQEMLFGVSTSPHDTQKIYGASPFGETLKQWVEGAPSFHLDQIKTPLRVEAIGPGSILGEWEIYSSLWQQGKPVDLIYIPDGQHILQKPLERMASQQGNVDWFRFWLKGEEDSDPLKATQYARWRELRKLQEQSQGKSVHSGSR